MKYSKALQTAAIETVLCVVHPEAWAAIRVGLIGLAFVLLRLALLLAFPITVPLLALNIVSLAHREKETRARLRADIHRNGRGSR